jgi:hypothetical protein
VDAVQVMMGLVELQSVVACSGSAGVEPLKRRRWYWPMRSLPAPAFTRGCAERPVRRGMETCATTAKCPVVAAAAASAAAAAVLLLLLLLHEPEELLRGCQRCSHRSLVRRRPSSYFPPTSSPNSLLSSGSHRRSAVLWNLRRERVFRLQHPTTNHTAENRRGPAVLRRRWRVHGARLVQRVRRG